MTNRILAATLLCLSASLLLPAACDIETSVDLTLASRYRDSRYGDRRPACPGRCKPQADKYWSEPLLVWTGPVHESPGCEPLGLLDVVEGGIRPRAALACPECACETRSCTDGIGLHATGAPECVPRMVSWHMHDLSEGTCMQYHAPQAPGYQSWQLEYSDGLCRPYRKPHDVERADELWEEAFLACRPRGSMAYRCEGSLNEYCVHPYEEPLKRGFQACVRYQDISARDDDPMWDTTICPPEYPEKIIGYLGVEPGCGECVCDLSESTACAVEVSVYGDKKCMELLGSKVVSLDDSCLTLPAPSMIGGVVIRTRGAGITGCEPRDTGPPQGAPKPVRREMFCCQPRGT